MASEGAQQQEPQHKEPQPPEPQKLQEPREPQEPQTFTEAMLGRTLAEESWARPWRELSPSVRVVVATATFAALLFLPYLGAVGLWDPWETHYGEVARSMVQRRDYVYPYWENAWFFSKPPFTMWLMALGMQVVGTLRTEGALALYTEWGMRVPFALLSIAAVVLLSLAVSRVASRRAGLACGFILATMPLYFLLTRQAVTDTPFVTTLACAMACALIGQLDESTRHRSAWWYGFYFFCGLSTLAKGLLGAGLPGLILILYAVLCVIPYDAPSLQAHLRWLLEPAFRAQVRQGQEPMPVLWGQMYRMRLGSGILLFLAVAAPWYLTLSLFEGVDDESKVFWYRFFVHDHLNRLAAGVHTTTPGGTFIYFIEQGGYAIFPWVALLPGALALATRLRLRSPHKADHLALIGLLWAGFTFTLMGLSATKFHHYVFPVLPGLAILLALFVDRLWEEGVAPHAVSLLLGLVLFVLVGKDLAANPKAFTDLFVYNYDRPYPWDLVTRPIAMFASRPLWVGDLVTLVLVAAGVWLALELWSSKQRPVHMVAVAAALLGVGLALLASMATRGRLQAFSPAGVALALVGGWVALQARKAPAESRSSLGTLAGTLLLVGAALFVRGLRIGFQGDALLVALSQPMNVKAVLGFVFTVAGGLLCVAAVQRSRTLLFGTFWALAAGFALWFNWGHWVDLSHHWTQRDLFWRYYEQRKPDEPIAAFLMNWRGETFYSRNTVKQIRETGKLTPFVNQPGREWVLVEHNRLNLLRQAAGEGKVVTPVDRDINNKFLLVTVE